MPLFASSVFLRPVYPAQAVQAKGRIALGLVVAAALFVWLSCAPRDVQPDHRGGLSFATSTSSHGVFSSAGGGGGTSQASRSAGDGLFDAPRPARVEPASEATAASNDPVHREHAPRPSTRATGTPRQPSPLAPQHAHSASPSSEKVEGSDTGRTSLFDNQPPDALRDLFGGGEGGGDGLNQAQLPEGETPLTSPVRTPRSRDVIVIDPGHGGRDPGAIANEMEEKEIALDVSLRLARYLEAAGFPVVLTRDDDSYPTLSERIEITERSRAILFLSVHANAARPEARGVETFYWGGGRHAQRSKQLAEAVQQEKLKVAPTLDRGAKTPSRRLYVLANAAWPAALTELGFMTNTEDAAYLRDSQMREELARALYNGIVRFYNAQQ